MGGNECTDFRVYFLYQLEQAPARVDGEKRRGSRTDSDLKNVDAVAVAWNNMVSTLEYFSKALGVTTRLESSFEPMSLPYLAIDTYRSYSFSYRSCSLFLLYRMCEGIRTSSFHAASVVSSKHLQAWVIEEKKGNEHWQRHFLACGHVADHELSTEDVYGHRLEGFVNILLTNPQAYALFPERADCLGSSYTRMILQCVIQEVERTNCIRIIPILGIECTLNWANRAAAFLLHVASGTVCGHWAGAPITGPRGCSSRVEWSTTIQRP